MKTPFSLGSWLRIPGEKPQPGGSKGRTVNAKDGVGEKDRGRALSLQEETKGAHGPETSRTSVASSSVINHLHEIPAVPSPISPAVPLTRREKAPPPTRLVKQYYSYINSRLQQKAVGPYFLKLCMACGERNIPFPAPRLGICEPGSRLRTSAGSYGCWETLNCKCDFDVNVPREGYR